MPIIAVSLNKIGADCIFPEFPYKSQPPQQLSSKSKGASQRFVDLYFCYNEEEDFLEAKHGWYCLTEGTNQELHSAVKMNFEKMLKQMRENKKEYKNREYIHFGFMPIVCYTAQSKDKGDFKINDILKEFDDLVDKRSGIQMLGFNYEIKNDVVELRKKDEDKPNIVYQIIFLGLFQSKKALT